jgi:hypothetical protein
MTSAHFSTQRQLSSIILIAQLLYFSSSSSLHLSISFSLQYLYTNQKKCIYVVHYICM